MQVNIQQVKCENQNVYWPLFTAKSIKDQFSYLIKWSFRKSGTVVVVIVWLQLPVQLVPITTKVVSSNHVHGEVYSIQH
jgi:hypothetical protein